MEKEACNGGLYFQIRSRPPILLSPTSNARDGEAWLCSGWTLVYEDIPWGEPTVFHLNGSRNFCGQGRKYIPGARPEISKGVH